MEITLILSRTAKGVNEAKNAEGKLSYDAVRLLRMVNGKASIGELRSQFPDLTDLRFEKALVALEDKKLVHTLAPNSPGAGERFEIPKLDKRLQELGQEFMQSLDFRTLERQLLDAMRFSPAQAAAQATAPEPHVAIQQGAAATAGSEPGTGTQDARNALEAKLRNELLLELRPRLEQELREKLTAALRPKIEGELRRQLVVALRPALESEIRTKLTTMLKPRVELELRAQTEGRVANVTQQPVMRDGAPLSPSTASPELPDATTAVGTEVQQRLLECIRETVFQTDLAGKSVYVNERWAKLTGYRREETLGQPLVQFFVPQDRDGMANYLDEVAHGGMMPVVFEASLARKSGTPLRVAIRAAPFTTSAGTITGVCGTLRGLSAAPATQ